MRHKYATHDLSSMVMLVIESCCNFAKYFDCYHDVNDTDDADDVDNADNTDDDVDDVDDEKNNKYYTADHRIFECSNIVSLLKRGVILYVRQYGSVFSSFDPTKWFI